ncbi:MAG TPA: hypothetical protein VMM82_01975 [Spirochaetia bacterium]|nr:hypothetical protein [Spirochaetia bacterium]
MEYKNRLYVILHPTTALIGSQYTPEQLARHYTVGPTRHYRGKVLFAEVDLAFRNPYFRVDAALVELKPHPDGRPKATKFISCYRVLEHLDLSALGSLYLSSEEGYCLEIQSQPYPGAEAEGEYLYSEISPLRMLVLSKLNFVDFGRFITDPENSIGAPKFLYTQLDLNVAEFMTEYDQNPFMQPPIENLHPSILRDAVNELRAVDYKSNKGLSLKSNLDNVSYKLIRKGFMFSSGRDQRFYPMPTLAEIEKKNLRFWKSL